MNISKLSNSTIVMLSVQDLKEFAAQIMTDAKKAAQEAKEAEEAIMTQEDVMKELHIKSRTTLFRWHRLKYLEPIYIGGKRMYRRSEVEAIKKQKAV